MKTANLDHSKKLAIISIICLALLVASSLFILPALNFVHVNAVTETLPSYCLVPGSQTYQAPSYGPFAPFSPQGTVLNVTTTSDDVDGNISSVSALLANPGSDGTISLREAILAINDGPPGSYTIEFAPSLKGKTILVKGSSGGSYYYGLPNITSSNVAIDGSISGGNSPDITLESNSSQRAAVGFVLRGSYDMLHALNLENFWQNGVVILPTQISTGDQVSNLNISNSPVGISFGQFGGSSNTEIFNALIINNVLTNVETGIDNNAGTSSHFTLAGAIIVNNVMNIIEATNAYGISITGGFDNTRGNILNTLVYNNTIYGTPGTAMDFAAEAEGGTFDNIDGLTVANNKILVKDEPASPWGYSTVLGIFVTTADSDIGHPTDANNHEGNIWILGNTISGIGGTAIVIQSQGVDSPVNNTINNVYVIGNNLSNIGDSISDTHTHPQGISVSGGNNGTISNIVIQFNTVKMGTLYYQDSGDSAITLANTAYYGPKNASLSDISVTDNYVNASSHIGISVIGGSSSGSVSSINNTVSGVDVMCNIVVDPQTTADTEQAINGTYVNYNYGGLTIIGGEGYTERATGSIVNNTLVDSNLIGGILDNYSSFNNVGNASGNIVVLSETSKEASLASNIANLQSEITSLNSEITTLNANITSLEGQVQQLDVNISSLETTIINLQQNATQNQNTISGLNADITTIENELSAIRTELSNRVLTVGTFASGGTPLAKTSVTVSNSTYSTSFATNSTGYVLFLGLASGNYQVSATISGTLLSATVNLNSNATVILEPTSVTTSSSSSVTQSQSSKSIEISSTTTTTTLSSTRSSVTSSLTSSTTTTESSSHTTSTTSKGGGGIPEFTFNFAATIVFTILVVGSYLIIRRRFV